MDVFLPLSSLPLSSVASILLRTACQNGRHLSLSVFVALSISLPFGIILRQIPIILLVYHKFRALHVKKKV